MPCALNFRRFCVTIHVCPHLALGQEATSRLRKQPFVPTAPPTHRSPIHRRGLPTHNNGSGKTTEPDAICGPGLTTASAPPLPLLIRSDACQFGLHGLLLSRNASMPAN